jgi:transcriptional regulator with XRE-family HTH domain
MTLAELLRQARGERSLRDAARILGVDTTNYKLWEEGVRLPKPERSEQLAAFTGLTKAEIYRVMGLLSEDEEITPRPAPSVEIPRKVRSRTTIGGGATAARLTVNHQWPIPEAA